MNRDGTVISRRAELAAAPLSYAQQSIWRSEQVYPGTALHNESAAFQLTGAVDVGAVERALGALAVEHEIMRSAVATDNAGEPRQVFAPEARLTVHFVDLTGADDADRERQLAELLAQAVAAPFDLRRPPLLRTHLIRTKPDRYLLVFVAHHIMVDAWAFGVFLEALAARYAQEIGAVRSPAQSAEHIAVDFGDYAAWQRGATWDTGDLDYWRDRLGGELPAVRLPTDSSRTAVVDLAGRTHDFTVPRDLVKALSDLGRAELATLPTVVLAAFCTFVQRFAGQDDLVVGMPVATRNHPRLASVIGPLFNVMAFRADLSGKPTFRSALRRVRQALKADLAHRDTPFDVVVDALGRQGTDVRNAVLQLMYAFHSGPTTTLRLSDVETVPVPSHNGTAKCDLSLFLRLRQTGALDATIEYRSGLFTEETVIGFADALRRILEGVVADPDQPLADVPVMSEPARQGLLGDFNSGIHVRPPWPTVSRAVRDQGVRAASAPAVRHRDTVLSYREVNAHADRVASRLRVVRGELVAIRVSRSSDMVPLLLGIWRAGAAFVPLDETAPAERVAQVLRDSGARLLITDEQTTGGGFVPETLVRDLLAPGPEEPAGSEPDPDDLAYVMYTSGSTGVPKGVAVPHRCVANVLYSVGREPGFTPDDVLVSVTSLGFDISVLELFAPLAAGGQVVIAERESAQDVQALGALLRSSDATVMQATPALWRGLIDGGWPGQPGLRAFSGGEPLDAGLAERMHRRVSEVWNLYGPTETTIWSTIGRVDPGRQVTVGRPIANTVCYILDPQGRPVPRGVSGELVIGGSGVAEGYWRRPELTASAFIPDPVGEADGTVYRTGDVARYLPDGQIVLLGRADDQVKIQGHRIELAEIDHALNAHPDVRQAAVVLDRRHPAGPRLVAFVALRDVGSGGHRRSLDTTALRGHLRDWLPPAVVPAVFAELPELPLTTSGKVDRPGLVRAIADLVVPETRVAPRTPVEAELAAIWASVTGVPADAVGVEDDFLTAGGNSISATRLLARARAAYGSAPSLAAFYTEPTLGALARGVHGEGGVVPGLPNVEGPAVPLTDSQRQVWLLHQMDPDVPVCNLAARVRLSGTVDVGALSGAVADLAARHEVLGAHCAIRDGEPVMSYEPVAEVRLEVVDSTGSGPADREHTMRELASAEARRPFDLDTGPLLRATLLWSPEESSLLITVHHIVMDGWSIGVATQDLSAFYAARTGGARRPGPLQVRFRDYAAAQHDVAAEAVRADHLKYWIQRLDGHPGTLELPADMSGRAHRTGEGALVPVTVPENLHSSLSAIAGRLRTTPFTVLLAGFAAVLGRYADSDDVLVGVPTAARDRPELEQLVGCFITTLPVRMDLSGNPSFAALVRRTGAALAADLSRPMVPFDRLVRELKLHRDPSRPPLVQAVLAFQDSPEPTFGDGRVTGELLPTPTHTAKHDLTLFVEHRPNRLAVRLEYNSDRFSRDLADRFAGHLITLLDTVLDAPDMPLDVVPLADPFDAVPASESGQEIPRARVHELISARARAAPDHVALRHGGEEVTYRDLDRWSDSVAARLVDRGAAPARFVAVVLPTGIAQTAAILGVAKSGAAFACLDLADATKRLAGMMRDTQPVCVLASENALRAHPSLFDAGGGTFGGYPVDLMDTPAPGLSVDGVVARIGSAGDPLCLVYTSGSTGSPKGIALPHATLAHFAGWQRQRFGIRQAGRIAQWAPFTYDAAYTEVFAALCSGATLCVPPDDVRGDPMAMVEWLRAERITQIQTVPAFFQMITDALDVLGLGLPDLQHVLLAGEVLPVALANAWAHRGDRPAIHNLYGPTECVLATHRELRPAETFSGQVPIGVPIPGREALVLDSKGRVCPVGVTGEIHLRSAYLAGAYHRRPEETARAYVADPWSAGGRIYRTGDLGRRLPDGELAFVGRLGSQVKLRGNRVELEGIEALLEAHPRVREAAATVHDHAGGAQLAAYAVADGVTGEQLRAHLAEQLPPAAVPVTVMLLDKLPRTRSNKRDRARLPRPAADSADTGNIAPRTRLEQLVAGVWCDLLGAERIGRQVNFFEAGGDSLLAARLQIELSRLLGLKVRLVDLFARPTIADFAAAFGPDEPASAAARVPVEIADPAADRRGAQRRAALHTRARARQRTRED